MQGVRPLNSNPHKPRYVTGWDRDMGGTVRCRRPATLSTKRPAILSSASAPTAAPGMIRTWPVDDPAGRFPDWWSAWFEPPGELGHRIVIRWGARQPARPELPGVSRCGPDGDADVLVADPQAAIEALLEDDRTAGPTASIAPSRQGEIPVRPADRAVPADPPGIVEAEDRLATQPVGPRPPGGRRVGGGDREPRIVPEEEARQEDVRVLDPGDPFEAQLGDEPVLERVR